MQSDQQVFIRITVYRVRVGFYKSILASIHLAAARQGYDFVVSSICMLYFTFEMCATKSRHSRIHTMPLDLGGGGQYVWLKEKQAALTGRQASWCVAESGLSLSTCNCSWLSAAGSIIFITMPHWAQIWLGLH